MMDLATRRADAERLLSDLKLQRGEATLKGEHFQTERIAAAEADLAAIGDAEKLLASRKPTEDRAAARVHYLSTLGEFEAADAARVAAVERLEAAALEADRALRESLATAMRARNLATSLLRQIDPKFRPEWLLSAPGIGENGDRFGERISQWGRGMAERAFAERSAEASALAKGELRRHQAAVSYWRDRAPAEE